MAEVINKNSSFFSSSQTWFNLPKFTEASEKEDTLLMGNDKPCSQDLSSEGETKVIFLPQKKTNESFQEPALLYPSPEQPSFQAASIFYDKTEEDRLNFSKDRHEKRAKKLKELKQEASDTAEKLREEAKKIGIISNLTLTSQLASNMAAGAAMISSGSTLLGAGILAGTIIEAFNRGSGGQIESSLARLFSGNNSAEYIRYRKIFEDALSYSYSLASVAIHASQAFSGDTNVAQELTQTAMAGLLSLAQVSLKYQKDTIEARQIEKNNQIRSVQEQLSDDREEMQAAIAMYTESQKARQKFVDDEQELINIMLQINNNEGI